MVCEISGFGFVIKPYLVQKLQVLRCIRLYTNKLTNFNEIFFPNIQSMLVSKINAVMKYDL